MTTVWNWYRAIHCHFHTAHPATKILQFMPNIRQNIVIVMYCILSPGMEYDTFPHRLGELVKEYEW